MGAAVLMLLPQAPTILQVQPSALSGGEDPAALKRCSCSSWHTPRSPGSLKPPRALSPSYSFPSTSYHQRRERLLPEVTGLGKEGIHQTNLACFLCHPETFAYDGKRDAALRLAHRTWLLRSLYQGYEICRWCSAPHDNEILEFPGVSASNLSSNLSNLICWSSRAQAWSNMWLFCSFPVSSQLMEMGQVRWAALLPLRASCVLASLPWIMLPILD